MTIAYRRLNDNDRTRVTTSDRPATTDQADCAPTWWRAAFRRGPDRSSLLATEASQEIGEVEELSVADRVENVGHRGVVAAPGIVFVFPQGFHQIVLALAGEAWGVLLAGIVPSMAEIAPMLLDERSRPPNALGI